MVHLLRVVVTHDVDAEIKLVVALELERLRLGVLRAKSPVVDVGAVRAPAVAKPDFPGLALGPHLRVLPRQHAAIEEPIVRRGGRPRGGLSPELQSIRRERHDQTLALERVVQRRQHEHDRELRALEPPLVHRVGDTAEAGLENSRGADVLGTGEPVRRNYWSQPVSFGHFPGHIDLIVTSKGLIFCCRVCCLVKMDLRRSQASIFFLLFLDYGKIATGIKNRTIERSSSSTCIVDLATQMVLGAPGLAAYRVTLFLDVRGRRQERRGT